MGFFISQAKCLSQLSDWKIFTPTSALKYPNRIFIWNLLDLCNWVWFILTSCCRGREFFKNDRHIHRIIVRQNCSHRLIQAKWQMINPWLQFAAVLRLFLLCSCLRCRNILCRNIQCSIFYLPDVYGRYTWCNWISCLSVYLQVFRKNENYKSIRCNSFRLP